MPVVSSSSRRAVECLLDQCLDLELDVQICCASASRISLAGPHGESISIDLSDGSLSMTEQVLQGLTFDFSSLPLLTIGESKEIRMLSRRVTLAKLLPTAYSFTNNRYGIVPGTERVRASFSADIFRAMASHPGPRHLSNAFLGLIDCPDGLLLAEQRVEPGNLEVRVKRYHIGSPIHRYRYTEQYETAFGRAPLTRWSRFDRPVVCFDWRHPLQDEDGRRLADEPLPDDYAAIWIDDLTRAKQLALDTFEWMESLFETRHLRLIDICYFVDRTGTVIFGEISPDCMRVRSRAADDSEALDKDEWRSGGTPQSVLERYQRLQQELFSPSEAPLALTA